MLPNIPRFAGLLMFGSYSVCNIIVLLNMLIAMMSNSYQVRGDVEIFIGSFHLQIIMDVDVEILKSDIFSQFFAFADYHGTVGCRVEVLQKQGLKKNCSQMMLKISL